MQHMSWRDKNTKPDEIKGDSHGAKARLYPDKPVNHASSALPGSIDSTDAQIVSRAYSRYLESYWRS